MDAVDRVDLADPVGGAGFISSSLWMAGSFLRGFVLA